MSAIEGIPDSAVRDLIFLGRAVVPADADADLLNGLEPFDGVNRQHWDKWGAVTSSLGEEDHRLLARGLVIAEERLRWSGGSVASAIWVYRSFEGRFPNTARELAAWMLQHSNNPWVPFGSSRGGARSLDELRAQKEFKAHRLKAAEEEEAMQVAVAEARRDTRHRLAELRSKIAKIEGTARAEMLREIESLPVRDRLLHIAFDNMHDLLFYPTELVGNVPSDLDRAGKWALQEVKNKAAAIHKGPWHKWSLAI